MDSSPTPDPALPVAIGAEVRGPDGSLGEVEKIIVDPTTERLTGVVVRHGRVFRDRRVLPLDAVRHADGSALYVDLDDEQFSALEDFDPVRYRSPDPDYSGPPGFDAAHGHNFNLENYVAMGPANIALGQAMKPLGYPGGEVSEPQAPHWDTVSEGDDVLDADGEKVGEVAAFVLDGETGRPARLTVRRGFLFSHEADLPLAWLDAVADGKIRLNVARHTVERLLEDD
ncbi:MAG: PRC-barrel domain-containing protein [Dehalococcoidia bacterium]|nr:PRC-barrel domain-containing protein [Dehalococcoidia bacterium]